MRFHRHSTRPHLIAVVLTCIWASAGACAPKSKAARGPIGDEIALAIESGTQSFSHEDFSTLLESGVREGLVDYEVFEARRAELDSYLDRVAEADLAALSGPHLKALIINAYNAYTIQSILDHPEVTSIRQIDGVWDSRTHRFGGFDVTLDNLEHNILRPYFKDPRIHMAVNCASMSCAPLPPWAFEGDRLDDQLEEWTTDFFATPKYLDVDDDELKVSKLLDWYGDDFTAADALPRAETLLDFVLDYAPERIVDWVDSQDGAVELRFFDYDWSLNRATPTS